MLHVNFKQNSDMHSQAFLPCGSQSFAAVTAHQVDLTWRGDEYTWLLLAAKPLLKWADLTYDLEKCRVGNGLAFL